jgi:hypothetical protein
VQLVKCVPFLAVDKVELTADHGLVLFEGHLKTSSPPQILAA